MWDDENYTEYYESLLYETTGCGDPEELIAENKYASKYIDENPIYGHNIGSRRNYSEEAFYLARKEGVCIEDTIGYARFNTIDTYLQDNICLRMHMFSELSSYPYATNYLLKHKELISWWYFSKNPDDRAIDFMEENPDKIYYGPLSMNTNPRAVDLLLQSPERIDWRCLSGNTCDKAVELLIANPERIDIHWMSKNTNTMAVEYLKGHPEKISWRFFTGNPCKVAVDFLARNLERIHWPTLCTSAKTKQQFSILRANLDRIVWIDLCRNPSQLAVDLLKEHPHHIAWHYSLLYQNVFETITSYDYAGIREARHDLHQEFHAWAGHPSKMVTKWKDWGFDCFDFDQEDEMEGTF